MIERHDPQRCLRCNATTGKPEGETTLSQNQFRSALQLEPQGENGAALTMLKTNSHAALLGAGVGMAQSIAGMASKINSAEVEDEKRQADRRQAVNGQVGKPVRNTTKSGLQPIVGPQ